MTIKDKIIERQRLWGCKGCEYCDLAAYGIKSCCTYPGKLELSADLETCLSRKEKGNETV